MGKGDRRTRKGKIIKGSYGNSRLRSDNKKTYTPEAKEQTES
ncbi:MAG TPA: 30S ribosomal protein THX [Cytophagales bacterium]|nr:30S ribosomal protein THX [Cytophagales bacterium]HAA22110.1 30S ribosomal protein THX [Cytophagales bacterium]HAP60835.1 30S ribosomal protein THX [Cytophagales bacterium]